MSASLAGLFKIESVSKETSSSITSPPATHQTPSSTAPTSIELDHIEFGVRYNGPKSGPQTPVKELPELPLDTQTPITPFPPITPNELEMSRPPSPKRDEAVNLVQTWKNPVMNKWRVLACCSIYFANGLNDSAPGALIPYMEEDYHIGYAIVSLIFVGNAVGFIFAASFIDMLDKSLGRARSLAVSEVFMLVAYVAMVATPPFPVVVVAFFLLGFGMAVQIALNNVFCSKLQPTSVIFGVAHGSYGIGGTIGPIMATAIASHGLLWSRFYFITLGWRVLNIVLAGWAFWSYKEEQPQTLLSALERTASRQATDTTGIKPEQTKIETLKRALKNRVTLFGAFFIFAYQGAEVSVSGWVISFLINYRNGDPAHVGYVTAGFWAGITLGRFILTHAAHRIGEKRFVVGLIVGSIAFQLMIWFIPNVIGDAVAVGILGLLLGPVYPCAQTIFSRTIPRHLQTSSISFISGAGSSGGAVAPFTTGLLAQAVGTYVLHPVNVGLYVLMLACWFGVPRVRKRTE